MPDYAIHDGTTVVNVIVADTEEIAAAVTGMDVVLATAKGPGIGWMREGSDWRSPGGALLSEIPDPLPEPAPAPAPEPTPEPEPAPTEE